MESNRAHRWDRLPPGVGIGMSINNGGGDADNEAEVRRQTEAFFMRMEGAAADMAVEDVEEDEEGHYDLHNEMDTADDIEEQQIEQDDESTQTTEAQNSDDIPEEQRKLQKERIQNIRFCTRLTVSSLMYPYDYARTLIQLGHEPMPAKIYQIWKFKPFVLLPGVHKYVKYIKQRDGFFGLYRGLVARVLGTTVGFLFSDIVLKFLAIGPYDTGPRKEAHPFGDFAWNLFEDSIRLTTASVLSYPFHLVMVRQAAQFVGREKVFETLLSSVKYIFKQEGIMGFYAGFVPKLIAEMTVLVVTSAMVHFVFRRYPKCYHKTAVFQMMTTFATYPLEVASSCMACSGTPLAAGTPPRMPIYGSWVDCLSDLYARGEHTRGIPLFWRTVPRFQISTGLLDGALHIRSI